MFCHHNKLVYGIIIIIVDFVVHLHVNICVNACTWLSLLTLHVHVHFYCCTIPLCTYTWSHTNASILLCVNIKICDLPQLLVTWPSHDRHMTQYRRVYMDITVSSILFILYLLIDTCPTQIPSIFVKLPN